VSSPWISPEGGLGTLELARSSTFLYGLSAFTTVRVQNGVPLLWTRHLERLSSTCALLELPEPPELEHLEHISKIVLDEALYRLTVTLEGSFGLYRPLETASLSPVTVWLSDVQIHSQLGAHKTGNYLPYALAAREAQNQNCFEALLRRGKGQVVDGSRSALLLEREGRFVVPQGSLPSVTRDAFLERHGSNPLDPNLPSANTVLEQPITLSDLRGADYLWLLGSGLGMRAVSEVRWHNGKLDFTVKAFENLEPPFMPPGV
jgi:4-amino-4-deoxychorismate lyase